MRKIILYILFLLPAISVIGQNTNPYLKGMAELSSNNYKGSIEAFSQEILVNPASGKAYLGRGKAYLNSNNLTKAEADFKLALLYNETEALIQIAKIHALNNNPSLCIQNIREYFNISSNYNKTDVLKDKAFQQIHYSNEWQDLVSEEWQSSYDKSLSEANYYLQKGLLKEGISFTDNAILNYGEKHELLFLRAKLNNTSGNLPLALADCYSAVELAPENVTYLEYLADIYSRSNNYEKAILYYKSTLELMPEEFSVYKKLAEAELLNNSSREAKKTISNYLQYFNTDTAAIFLSAEIYYSLEEYQSSLQNLNKLIENYPPHASWFLKRGLCYEKTGTLKYAAADLSMCLDLDPFNPTANLKLGTVQQKLGNKESACYYWERALNAGALEATQYILENCQK